MRRLAGERQGANKYDGDGGWEDQEVPCAARSRFAAHRAQLAGASLPAFPLAPAWTMEDDYHLLMGSTDSLQRLIDCYGTPAKGSPGRAWPP